METNVAVDIEAVKGLVVETLGLESRANELEASTPLLGALPELDSLAVVEVLVELEARFGIDADAIDAEAFETLGSLTEFVERQAL